ncbi:MAG: amidohydrolase family protein [Chloroflexota bacterium]
MSQFFIVDSHVHTYQSREIGLQAKQDGGETDYAGTVEETLSVMKAAGISKSVMLNLLPVPDMRDAALSRLAGGLTPEQHKEAVKEIDSRMVARIQRRNQWTCDVARENPSLVPALFVDPIMGAELMKSEIAHCVAQGARAVKLHPNLQRIYPDDEGLFPLYEAAQELEVPVVSHCGISSAGTSFAEPRYFLEVLFAFPELVLVLAHLGSGFQKDIEQVAVAYANTMFDCSAIISEADREDRISCQELASMIRRVGTERVMFGSDFPWYDPAGAISRLVSSDLTDDEKRQILSQNAARVFRLP